MAKVTIAKAIEILLENYNIGKDAEYVRKPVSWALWQTWKICDGVERTRSELRKEKENE